MSRHGVRMRLAHDVRADLCRTPIVEHFLSSRQGLEGTGAEPERNMHRSVPREVRPAQTGVLGSKLDRGQRQLGMPAQAVRFQWIVHERLEIEVGDLAGNSDRVVGGVEESDLADAALPCENRGPAGVDTNTDGRERPDPGDDNAAR